MPVYKCHNDESITFSIFFFLFENIISCKSNPNMFGECVLCALTPGTAMVYSEKCKSQCQSWLQQYDGPLYYCNISVGTQALCNALRKAKSINFVFWHGFSTLWTYIYRQRIYTSFIHPKTVVVDKSNLAPGFVSGSGSGGG